MTEGEHTTAKLARALEPVLAIPRDMVERAKAGYYHDFLSPLDMPEVQLVADLRAVAANRSLPRSTGHRRGIRRLPGRVRGVGGVTGRPGGDGGHQRADRPG
jgi:hypothetical protein